MGGHCDHLTRATDTQLCHWPWKGKYSFPLFSFHVHIYAAVHNAISIESVTMEA
jgi:hypothetical protein